MTFLRSKWQQLLFYLGVSLGKPFLQLVFELNKWRVTNGKAFTDALSSGKSVIVCCWHGRLVFPFYFLTGKGGYVLAGLHRDGELATRIFSKAGWQVVRGSSSRGGMAAYQTLIRTLLRKGSILMITPDGPRGPEQRVKPGAVRAAVRTGSIIIPMSGQASRRWEITNWDTFVVPKPAGRASVVFGEPIEPDQKGDIETICQHLEEQLNRVGELADAATFSKD